MYKLIILFFITSHNFIYAKIDKVTQQDVVNAGLSGKSVTYKCNKVFEDRKEELIQILDDIKDKQQVINAVNRASKVILDKKSQTLNKKEKKLNKKEKMINIKFARLQNEIKKNEAILNKIRKILLDKIIETYSKMKATKAAIILNNMKVGEVAEILFLLKPAIMGNILAKMQPKKASDATLMIKKGPPFAKDLKNYAIKNPDEIKKAIKEDFK